MPASRYRYRALDAQGQRLAGELVADSPQAAMAALAQRRLTVLDLADERPAAARAPRLRRRIGAAERVVVLREFATLLNAGVSIAEAAPSLEAAYAGTALGAPMARLRKAVQDGRSVADAFRGAELGLPEHAHSLVAAGEAAGRLGQALDAGATQLEYELDVRQQMRTALVYPAVLVGAGALALLVIFVVVVPRFAPLVASGRAEVPALSRWVIETGLLLQAHALAAALAAAAVVAALAAVLRMPALRQAARDGLARLPVVGPWLRGSETGRWATLLGTLLQHRVPMLQALELSTGAVGLGAIRRHLVQAQGEIRRGRALSAVLAEQGWIAPTRLNLIRVGERAGELPRMLGELGRMHTEAARAQQKRLLALVEPAAILVIGTLIGIVMVAVVMAVTSLNTARM